jgi:hypothetical protein
MQNQPQSSSSLDPVKAVVIGHLFITVPVLIIIIASFIGGPLLYGGSRWLYLLGGSLIAWLFWAIAIPQWRKWVVAQNTDYEKVKELAVKTGLIWKEGSIFEKTEFRRHK